MNPAASIAPRARMNGAADASASTAAPPTALPVMTSSRKTGRTRSIRSDRVVRSPAIRSNPTAIASTGPKRRKLSPGARTMYMADGIKGEE